MSPGTINRPTRGRAAFDRRWIFLLLAAAILVAVLTRAIFPERTTPPVQAVFDRIEALPAGARVLVAMDYDFSNAPEVQPMATAWAWHCARKHHKLYFVSLWPLGPRLTQDTVNTALREFPEYKYGADYVQLGFKPGNETVIRTMVAGIRELFTTDQFGTSLGDLPLTRDLTSLRQFDLILSASAGAPGAKEWILYAATPLNIPLAAGCTGVQAPLLYPYLPRQMFGMLGAIKGAAEYEQALLDHYPEYGRAKDGGLRPQFTQGIRRMGPQLVAHCVILGLIVAGNIALLIERRRRRATA
jgi:hypothetical protein